MRSHLFLSALSLLACGQDVPPSETVPAQVLPEAPPEEWTGALSCTDGEMAVGWGPVLRCDVESESRFAPERIHLFVLVGDQRLPAPPFANVQATFRRSDLPYGPPTGYHDEGRTYWTLSE